MIFVALGLGAPAQAQGLGLVRAGADMVDLAAWALMLLVFGAMGGAARGFRGSRLTAMIAVRDD